MKTINIYVGKTDTHLVLKYPVGLESKKICRYYDCNEDPKITMYYLKLEMKEKPILFKSLLDKNKSHGIRPANKSQLEKLASVYKKVKI